MADVSIVSKGGQNYPRTTPHPHIVFNPHHQQTLAIQHQSVPTALIYYMLLILILVWTLLFDIIQREDVSW